MNKIRSIFYDELYSAYIKVKDLDSNQHPEFSEFLAMMKTPKSTSESETLDHVSEVSKIAKRVLEQLDKSSSKESVSLRGQFEILDLSARSLCNRERIQPQLKDKFQALAVSLPYVCEAIDIAEPKVGIAGKRTLEGFKLASTIEAAIGRPKLERGVTEQLLEKLRKFERYCLSLDLLSNSPKRLAFFDLLDELDVVVLFETWDSKITIVS